MIRLMLTILYVPVIFCETFKYASTDQSNGIQFSVLESENRTLKREYTTRSSSKLQWLSKIFDHHNWWTSLEDIEVPECKDDMILYLKELRNGTSWANKMYDASGRYPTQFLFGNDYWLGSKTLCEELASNETNGELPAFQVQFYVAKVRMNISEDITPTLREVTIGQCLPKSCAPNAVRSILEKEMNGGSSLRVLDVRKVPGDYSLLSDFKVYTIGAVSLVLVIIIIISTSVDALRISRSELKRKDLERFENNNKPLNRSINGSKRTANSNGKKNTRDDYRLKLLHCFSARHNGGKIISVRKVSVESIKCIHGLRFFSIAWIILVHTYLEVFAVADNKHLRTITERNFMYQTISNATFSVDTFFFISGLLVTLTYFRANSEKRISSNEESSASVIRKSSMEFLVMLIYRFCRLTPAYMFVLGINEIILRYLHSNSVFTPGMFDHITCDKYWWRNALYINNLFPQSEICMLWSWYMANDSQFYILASLLLLIAIRSRKHLKVVGAFIGVLFVVSWITSFIIAMKWDYVARVETPFALFDQLYDKPWLRIGPYLVGMVMGYLLFIFDCKVPIPSCTIFLGWVLSLSCLGSLVYGLGKNGLMVPSSAFYVSLGHTAWGLSLAWITLACSSGYGGPVNWLLSSEIFLPLSRLTYCAYLVHPVIMCLTSFHLDGPLHLHNTMAIVIFCGNLVLSFLTAFVISLMFEAPVVNLLKIVL